ncbi:YtxH domain-containing protein [Halobacillus rhizosphaerae]|uniref:YtxH domain-containing protein n=1 Tax=Halobacillus rhizosphaerae TaxID=3064889 RepID=UPI00398A9B40
MSQHKLWKGVLLGALVGGAAMLFDRDTRSYVGEKSRSAGRTCKGFAKHPSEAVHSLRVNYESMAKRLNDGADSVLDLLNKLEDIMIKVNEMDKEVQEQLRAVNNSKEAS